MSITATELKTDLGKYLLLSKTEDIYITRNGKIGNGSDHYKEHTRFKKLQCKCYGTGKISGFERQSMTKGTVPLEDPGCTLIIYPVK